MGLLCFNQSHFTLIRSCIIRILKLRSKSNRQGFNNPYPQRELLGQYFDGLILLAHERCVTEYITNYNSERYQRTLKKMTPSEVISLPAWSPGSFF
ncbi:IS3 family transposase [Paenibacillus sp. FSL K6-0276]|uniref:IS3 family transposase n=1 Tax=Paenibacillus sp. FSL K6-0276 TaxID=2921450 RepID=UPI0030EBA15E